MPTRMQLSNLQTCLLLARPSSSTDRRSVGNPGFGRAGPLPAASVKRGYSAASALFRVRGEIHGPHFRHPVRPFGGVLVALFRSADQQLSLGWQRPVEHRRARHQRRGQTWMLSLFGPQSYAPHSRRQPERCVSRRRRATSRVRNSRVAACIAAVLGGATATPPRRSCSCCRRRAPWKSKRFRQPAEFRVNRRAISLLGAALVVLMLGGVAPAQGTLTCRRAASSPKGHRRRIPAPAPAAGETQAATSQGVRHRAPGQTTRGSHPDLVRARHIRGARIRCTPASRGDRAARPGDGLIRSGTW